MPRPSLAYPCRWPRSERGGGGGREEPGPVWQAGNGGITDGEKLQKSTFKTSADAAEAGALAGAAPGVFRSVVQAVFAVKPDDVSKVVDANGERLLVSESLASAVR